MHHPPALRILVGSVSGTALRVADAIAIDCANVAGPVEVLAMDRATADVFDAPAPLTLLCVSTYGAGDLPDQALPLYEALVRNPRYLGHLRYGLIALGDSSHGDTFCGGGRRFDGQLQDLGAHRVGDMLQLDALDAALPEAEAAAWCRRWMAQAFPAAMEG